MKYEAKYRLNRYQYLAVLDKALAIVTVDKNGNFVRAAIFGKDNTESRKAGRSTK